MSNPTSLSTIKKDQLPSELDARLQVLRGDEADLLFMTPRAGELMVATDTGRTFSGDGFTVGGIPQRSLGSYGEMAPAGCIEFTSMVAPPNSVNVQATTTGTSQYGVIWWDGSVSLHNSGTGANKASTGYSSGPRKVTIFPVKTFYSDAGHIATAQFGDMGCDSVKVGYCPSLTSLRIQSVFAGTFLDLRGAVALTTLDVSPAGNLKFIENLPSTLTGLWAESAVLEYVDLRGTSLSTLVLSGGAGTKHLPLAALAPSIAGLSLLDMSPSAVRLSELPSALASISICSRTALHPQDVLTALPNLTSLNYNHRQAWPAWTPADPHVTLTHANLTGLSLTDPIGNSTSFLIDTLTLNMPNLDHIWGLTNVALWHDTTKCNAFFDTLPLRTPEAPGWIPYNGPAPAGDTAKATARNWNVYFDV